MPNAETMQALSEVPIPVWIGAGLLGLAFTREVARKIGKRANWGCEEEGCDKNWKDGWKMDAAHKDHSRSNPDYNDPDNGWFLCLAHHLLDHLKRGDTNSANLIQSRMDKGERWRE